MTSTAIRRLANRDHLVDLGIAGLFATLPLANTLTMDIGFPLTMAHLFAGLLTVVGFGPQVARRSVRTWLPLAAFAGFWLVSALSMALHLGVDYGAIPWASGRQAPEVRSITTVLWLGGNIVIALVLANSIDTGRRIRIACAALIVGSVVAAMYGVYQVLGFSHGIYIPLLPDTEFVPGTASFWVVPRAKGTFLEPSFFGAFLAATLPFAGRAAAGVPTWLFRPRVAFAAVVIVMAGEVVTFSIGGWIPAAAGLVALVFLAGRRVAGRLVGVAVASAALALAITVVALPNAPTALWVLAGKGAIAVDIVMPLPSAEPDASNEPEPTPEVTLPPEYGAKSAGERVATTRAALSMFADSPLLGVGPGNFPFLYGRYRPVGTTPPQQVLIANNVYAQLMAETGVIGAVMFAGGALAIAVTAIRTIRSGKGDWESAAQAGLAGLVAVAVNLLTGPSFTILFQWALIGLLCAAIAMARRPSPDQAS
jgi:O-antigen ligase